MDHQLNYHQVPSKTLLVSYLDLYISFISIQALDGNGQFYLCLQDLALGNLSEKAERVRSTMKGESRRKVVIAIMDEGMFQNFIVS